MAFLFLFNVLPKNSLLPKLMFLTSKKRSEKVEKRPTAPKPIFWVGKKDDGVDLNRKLHLLRNSHLLWRPSWWQKGEPWKTRALPLPSGRRRAKFFFQDLRSPPPKKTRIKLKKCQKRSKKVEKRPTAPKPIFWVGKKDDGVDLNRKLHLLRNSHLLYGPSWWQKGDPSKKRVF